MMSCPLCKSTVSVAWHTFGEWQLRRCSDCGLGRLDPQPPADELAEFYGAAYFDERKPQNQFRATAQMSRSFRRRLALIRRFQKSGRLLDAGCGEGNWLTFAANNGFDATGFDVSDAAVARNISSNTVVGRVTSRGENGNEPAASGAESDETPRARAANAAYKHNANTGTAPRVVVGVFGNAPVQGPFDIITAWHSLEHAPDPLAALRWLNSLLKPGGLLVVEVPNCESDDALRLGESWDGWKPPFHLWHFAPATLRRALQCSGFVPSLQRCDSSRWARERFRKIPVVSLAKGALAHCWTGTSLCIAARKETTP
jgi:SAM-dependent methyltransferase